MTWSPPTGGYRDVVNLEVALCEFAWVGLYGYNFVEKKHKYMYFFLH